MLNRTDFVGHLGLAACCCAIWVGKKSLCRNKCVSSKNAQRRSGTQYKILIAQKKVHDKAVVSSLLKTLWSGWTFFA